MTGNKQKIASGIYLVIDPSMEEVILLDKLRIILQENIAAVQIWDHFRADQDIDGFISKTGDLCSATNTPVFINNRWELLMDMPLDGVHFDRIPENLDMIRKKVKRAFICGLTCNNDLSWVHWAKEQRLDYISFCSMFPSTTATSCDLVDLNTVQQARHIFPGPIFLAGGIKPENIDKLRALDYDGVAVISGIMSSPDPIRAINQYNEKLLKQ